MMTRAELAEGLAKGKTLESLLDFTDGQDCQIFKASGFSTGEDVIYIPDISLNEIPVDVVLNRDNSLRDSSGGKWGSMTAQKQIQVALSYCYTGESFVEICNGDEALAYRLFQYVDWQHPSSALDEVVYDDEADRAWAEETYASFREKQLKPAC